MKNYSLLRESRVLRRYAILPLLLFMCCACGEPAPKPLDPMGLGKKYSQEAEANFALARALWGTTEVCKDPEQAIEYLDKAIALAPDFAEAYQRRGLARSDLRDWDGAFDDLTKAIRLRPVAENYAYRGLVSMRGGNALGAKKDFDRSLALDKKQHLAWNFRGGLNLLLNDYPNACADFRQGCANGDCTGLESAKQHGVCE